MRDKLNDRFERLKGRSSENNGHDDATHYDVALYANFKGNCPKCGKQGHRGTDFSVNRVVCWYCVKTGHIRTNCDLWK